MDSSIYHPWNEKPGYSGRGGSGTLDPSATLTGSTGDPPPLSNVTVNSLSALSPPAIEKAAAAMSAIDAARMARANSVCRLLPLLSVTDPSP
ncbi:MAG: hypothetical protein LBG62_04000 [Candidatus Methanoplasma sp.]|nr:hypothetical protein [Candidatus Methanoplasma sp.]